MVHINFTKSDIIAYGVLRGLQISFFGSFIFATLFVFIFMWMEPSSEPAPFKVLEIIGMSLVTVWPFLSCSILPSILSGITLVYAINKLSTYKPIDVDDAVLVGFLTGMVATGITEGLGLLILALIANAEKPNQPFTLFTDPTFYGFSLGGIFLGGLVGGYVGQRFMRHLLAKQEMLLSAAAADVHFTAEENTPPIA